MSGQHGKRARSAAALGAILALGACGPRAGTPGARGSEATSEAPTGDPREAPPAAEMFSEKVVANLFSHPGPLVASDVDMGPAWAQKGKVVWAASYAAADGSFAPLTLILFEGHYRGLTITDNQRDLLRRSALYKDLDFGHGRTGYALRASNDDGGAEETALIRSPRGRFELLLLVSVPKGGPAATKESEAYRSLLMEYTVRLMESVAKGMSELWKDRR